MDFINLPLLAAAALLFFSLLLGLVSTRIGFPFLLVFLVAGALAGEDGPGGYRFSDFFLSFWVGNVALAVILLDGGLRTSFSTFRAALKPSVALATVGVAVSAAVTGLAAMWLLELNWRQGMLLGAIVGSTDAAAVFSVLGRSGVRLNERVRGTLEIESGMNDPMAIYLTLAFIGLAISAQPAAGAGSDILLSFVRQFGWGALIGVAGGLIMTAILLRLPADDGDAAIMALLVVAGGVAVFATTGFLGGSGFLAVYLFGLVLTRRARPKVTVALSAMEGYAWLAQAGMFLLLGLLVTPSALAATALPALGVAAALMFVARPLSVWLCLALFRFPPREVWFISWVGLRGAVPTVLAVFPLMAGVPDAMLLFNVAFVVVLASLLFQGTTIRLASRLLAVGLPDRTDEQRTRVLFGDFTLDAKAPIGTICSFYDLPKPETTDTPVGDWLARALRREPVVGDDLRVGHATLSVRAMEGAKITAVGLKLEGDLDAARQRS